MLSTYTYKFKTGIKSLLNVNYNVHIYILLFQQKTIRYYTYKIFIEKYITTFQSSVWSLPDQLFIVGRLGNVWYKTTENKKKRMLN